MLRFYFVIILGIFLNLYFLPMMWYFAKHPEKYTESDCYLLACDLINMIKNRGGITTISTGTENLPEQGGYIMYANHQGKYDSLGILSTHTKPCTVIMDKETSKKILPRLFIQLIKGKKLDKQDPKQQITIINEVVDEISKGRRYLIFPEGGYTDNKNSLQLFHSGSFKIPLKAKCPIIPVVLYDSYKPFTENSLAKITTQVHYLEPISYDYFSGMKSKEIAELVGGRIQDKMIEIEYRKSFEAEAEISLEKVI